MPTDNDFNGWIAAVAASEDREAFAALFRHFAPRIKSYLMRSGTPPDVAEELAQDAMVNVWRRAAYFDPARAAASTWIFTLARNLRIDQHRRAQVHDVPDALALDEVAEAAMPAADEAAGPHEQACAAELAQLMRHALSALPVEQAQVLRLSYFEDHAHARIAQELKLPLGTVKSRIRLAVAELRRTLDGLAP